jgi:hypothetical protein
MPRQIWHERTYIGHDIYHFRRETYDRRQQEGHVSFTALMAAYPTYLELSLTPSPVNFDPVGAYCPVWDRHVNDWVWLNSDVNSVDYVVTDLRHDRVAIKWVPNWDFQKIRIFLTNQTTGVEQTFVVDPKVNPYRIYNLDDDTVYGVNVYADLPWGVTNPHRQTFKTPRNPIPDPPTRLRHTARSNTSITLEWDASFNSAEYAVYLAVENGPWQRAAVVRGTSATIGLHETTRYRFTVRGVNSDGLAGPESNSIKSATGRNEVRRQGHTTRLVLPPARTGSWRGDIGWNWWYTWPEPDANNAIYQGYWQYQSKRYWGVIEYDPVHLRNIINGHYGAGVAEHLRVSEASIRRVYRQQRAGNPSPLELVWHLTNSKAHAHNAQPSVYGQHINNHDSADSLYWQRGLAAGTAIDFLRIPRGWGEAIIRGQHLGLVLHRGDNERNGYGYAGYMKISGHMQPDYHLGSQGWRYSDLSLVVSANWDYVVLGYQGPYDW